MLCSDYVFFVLYLPVFDVHVFVSCLVVSYVVPLCPLSSPVFSCVLPCLLVLFSPGFLLCAFPLVSTPGLLPPLSPHLFLVWSSVSLYLVCGCGSVQGQHPSECLFEVRSRHDSAWSLSQFKEFSKCSTQTPPSFACCWRTHRYDPSRLQIAQDSLRAQREEVNK